MNRIRSLLTLCLFIVGNGTVSASGYEPARVVYDVSSSDSEALHAILDRTALLQEIYGNDPFESSIVVVIHEGAIPSFSTGEASEPDLLERVSSFAMGEVIQFRLCRASARQQGLNDGDFPDFIQLVPMADAEIIQLQNEGYAYLH